MTNTIYYIDKIDNNETLFKSMIEQNYPYELWDLYLTNTKVLRNYILEMIVKYVDHEGEVVVKEFSDVPPMIYDDLNKFKFGIPEISTNTIIVNKALTISTIEAVNSKFDAKYSLMVEALDTTNISTKSWNNYLDELYIHYCENRLNARITKIVVEDTISVLTKWDTNTNIKDKIKAYFPEQGIVFDSNTYWKLPLSHISKTYWEKFSFVLTINDYDFYDPAKEKYLDCIANELFDKGCFDEIVITMNYWYWADNYKKIMDWTKNNVKSVLISYRLNTIFDITKNRYFNNEQATHYNDYQRKNTPSEIIEMYKNQLPVFLNSILENPQTYGFELKGGYFGREGNVPQPSTQSDEFTDYKDHVYSNLVTSPFANLNDNSVVVFRESNVKVFTCVKQLE
jgi:hypothetical protein